VQRVYLDHAATTSMLPQARAAWLDVSERVGNASSLHTSGRAARRVVESARESIAEDLGIRPSAVIFTGGGTESDNLAIKGLYWARCSQLGQSQLTIVSSAIEHHAVLDPVMWLSQHEGAAVEFASTDRQGRVSVLDIEKALVRGGVALVSIMWANNEIGAIQPIHEIAKLCKKFDVPFHTDAVQALGQLSLGLGELDATAVTISSHKIGGPVGVGALIVDPFAKFTPVMHGGGQEREIRSGTFDPASIAAFAAAIHYSISDLSEHAARLWELQEYLIAAVMSAVPEARLNGPPAGVDRLPNNTHFSFPGCEGDSLLMLLDAAGIDCSTGSACTAGIPEPSHVLLSMGVDEKTARASLRFSLGRDSTKEGIDQLAQALPGVVERALRAGSVSA
jgi:cysteine desulfurase